jgi:MoaA/NifB/PqqE/SkfB family radical SAM enzyme
MIEYKGKQVTIMCTSTCNCKCKHCYISYKGDIDPEVLYDMCKTLSKKYKLVINGTEVLLNEGYLKSLSISKQKRVLTNGIVIHNNKELLDKVHDTSSGAIALSYHYGIHSDISSVAYQVILDDIKLIKESNLKVALMCTISSSNYDKVVEICDNAYNLGVDEIRFFNYLNIGNALNLSKENILTEKQLYEFFKGLSEARNKYSIDELRIKRNGTFGEDTYIKSDKFSCVSGYDEVVIAPNMKVYPCIYMTADGYEIGEFKDGKVYLYKKPTHNRKLCLCKKEFNGR